MIPPFEKKFTTKPHSLISFFYIVTKYGGTCFGQGHWSTGSLCKLEENKYFSRETEKFEK